MGDFYPVYIRDYFMNRGSIKTRIHLKELVETE